LPGHGKPWKYPSFKRLQRHLPVPYLLAVPSASPQQPSAIRPAPEREALVFAARAPLATTGPHYIIDSTAELMPIIDDVSARLARGERP